jgi:Sulfatase-modifying factor enzyme 1/TIR domain
MDQQARYDLFLLFADAERAWVSGYLRPELGVSSDRIITHDAFQPGAPLADEFERAVEQSRFTILVLSPSFMSDRWASFGEHLATWTSVEGGAARVVPLVRHDVDLPTRLRFRVKLDCIDEGSWPEEIGKLRALLDRPEPQPELPIDCPYPGMVPFELSDESRFFGREDLARNTANTLVERPFLALIGASGSGKSSFINAGLIPTIARDFRFGKSPPRVVRFRPGPSPIDHLAAEIAALSGPHGNASEIGAALTATGASLRPVLDAIPAGDGGIGLLIVDQFEEAFAQCKNVPLRLRFFDLLAGFLDEAPKDWRVVLAIRADFYEELQTSPLFDRVTPLLDLKPLSDDELRTAIERPARNVGVHMEPGLVDALVGDAKGETGPLPLLQQTLVYMWAQFLRRRLLTLADYRSLGSEGRSGLQEALKIWADATMAALKGHEEIVRRIFVRLIEFGPQHRDTRRQQSWDDLVDSGDTEADVERVLEVLVERRLVTTDRDAVTGDALVDLAHETIIEAWPQLHEWVDTYQTMESRRRQLVLAATNWQAAGRDDSFTFRARQLRDTEAWARQWPEELGYREREFLIASQSAERKQQRARRLSRGLAAGIAIVAVGATLLALGRGEIGRASAKADLVSFDAGPAVIGSDNEEHEDQVTEVGPFSLEVHEVSNAQYLACDDGGPCDSSSDPQSHDPAVAQMPVVWVTAPQAETYCAWLGLRLPTNIEWERAARGTEGRRWPWGDEAPRMSVAERRERKAVDTGSQTMSEDGIYHLVGNVSEWVRQRINGLDLYGIAGGSNDLPVENVTDITITDPAGYGPSTGFRCAAGGA